MKNQELFQLITEELKQIKRQQDKVLQQFLKLEKELVRLEDEINKLHRAEQRRTVAKLVPLNVNQN